MIFFFNYYHDDSYDADVYCYERYYRKYAQTYMNYEDN